jgi:flagellar motor switch protein FliG
MSLSGYEKAAIFLTSVGEEAATEVFKCLDMEDIGKISQHMTRLKKVKRTAVVEVFKEAYEIIAKGDFHHVGGEEFLKRILSKRLGEEGATKILQIASQESPFDALKSVDSRTLMNLLIREHPQTIALILCLLEPVQAAKVLTSLPDELMADVSMRIANIESIPENAIEEINEVLKGQLNANKSKGKKLSGVKTIAGILNQCNRNNEQVILEKIYEHNNTLAESIKRSMFTFEDLVKIDDRGIQNVLKEISTEDLAVALKTTSEALKEKIFKNMSQRAVQMLKEEMQTKGPIRVSDVEKAQQTILSIIKKLEADGKIVLGGKGGEELIV